MRRRLAGRPRLRARKGGVQAVLCGGVDVVGTRNVRLRFARSEPLERFLALMGCTPRACARFLPSPVRARISSRSNSAKPPRTVSITRPCDVVVSAQASLRERKPAPALATTSSTFSKSRVDLASRSRRETITTSPGPRARSSLTVYHNPGSQPRSSIAA